MGSETGYADVDGAQIYYEIAGEGEPVVLVHGFTLDTRMWDDQFDALSARYKVVRYDVRGYGKSSVPEEGSPYSNAADLRGLLDHLDIEKAHVIGLSMGGSIAINFTLEYPERVTSLVPVDSSLGGYDFSTEFSEWLMSLYGIAQESGVAAANEEFMSGALFESAMGNPAVAVRLRGLIGSYSGWSLTHDDPEVAPTTPAVMRLHEIECHTLVVVGEHDLPDFHGIADEIDGTVPNSRKMVIPGVGHMSNIEDPETFNGEILAFLDTLR